MGARETGDQILTELVGPEFLEMREAKRNSFNGPLQDYVAEVCFGQIWARPEMSRKMRSLLTIAMLVAMGRPGELRIHVHVAVAKNGCTAEEIREVLLHAAMYCGLPAAASASEICEGVLRELGELS